MRFENQEAGIEVISASFFIETIEFALQTKNDE